MNNVSSSPEANKNGFTQIAHVLIQGYPELDLQDRYVPIALASVCWEEKFYPLSLRQIASITRVNHTALRSRAGQHPREGVLDRLKRVGILDFRDEKPIDPATGKEGRSQTYICIKYSNIWRENAKFSAEKKAIKVAASVDVVNSDKLTTVDTVNHTVDVVNVTVDTVNHTVDGVSVNAAHNTNKTINTNKTVGRKAETLFPELPPQEKQAPAKNSYSQQNQQPTKEKKKVEVDAARGYTNDKSARPQLTEGGQAVKDAWVSLFKVKSSVQFGPKSITLANELHEPLSEWTSLLGWSLADALKDIKNHAYKIDPAYYREKGFQFWNIAQVLEGWQSAKQGEIEGKQRAEKLRAQLLAPKDPDEKLPCLTAEQWNALKTPKGDWRAARAARLAQKGIAVS